MCLPGILPGMFATPLIVPEPQPAALQRHVHTIVVHCSATPSGQWLHGARGTPGFEPAVDVIDRWHAARGFARTPQACERFNPLRQHVGYHYVVDLDGYVDTGRSLIEPGAHVAGFNAASVGICLVGGAERDARYTRAQWTSLAVLVRMLCKQLGVPALAPLYPRHGGGVCGHRDLSPDTNGNGRVEPQEWLKTCPGFDVGAWMGRGLLPLTHQVCEVPA